MMNKSINAPRLRVPHLHWTPMIYRFLLRLTRRHGLFTIARQHVRRYPAGQIVTIPMGGHLYIPGNPHFIGFLAGIHEEHISRALVEAVPPGSVCIDVGANIGYFSVMMSSLTGKDGLVYSFEPEPENYRVLAQNATLTQSSYGRIDARNFAVSDGSGMLRLIPGEESTLHQVERADADTPLSQMTPSIALDSLGDEIGGREIAMLKIDVEGHELPVVLGAHKLISSGKLKNLIIEVTPGPDAVRLEQEISPHAKSAVSWMGNRWESVALSQLNQRTDVWVRF